MTTQATVADIVNSDGVFRFREDHAEVADPQSDAGNPHVRFDERGRETGRCRMAQATAPFLNSTTPATYSVSIAVAADGRVLVGLGGVPKEAGCEALSTPADRQRLSGTFHKVHSHHPVTSRNGFGCGLLVRPGS